MRHEPTLPDDDGAFDLARFAREIVLSAILMAKEDKAEMKARIMIAREHGHLTDNEAAAWIARHGLEAA